MNNQAPTPETDAAANESIVRVYETSQRLERERGALLDSLDTLTLVIGLTPVKGNLEALQEAVDRARATIALVKGSPES